MLTMMLIPPGEFQMGSTAEEQTRFLEEARAVDDYDWAVRRLPCEGPQHQVRITKPFYLGKYEVTQAQWHSVLGTTPSSQQSNSSHPIKSKSWNDIQPFLARLNASSVADKLKFELPTEAQWEYALRAGSMSAYSFGNNAEHLAQYAWFAGNSDGKLHPVGQLKPNGFNMFDMHGNVWEWCADRYADEYYARSPVDDPTGPAAGSSRVRRGGGWDAHTERCRSAYRGDGTPGRSSSGLGFRLSAALTLDEPGRQVSSSTMESDRKASAPLSGIRFKEGERVEIPDFPFLKDRPVTIEAWVTKHSSEPCSIIDWYGETRFHLSFTPEPNANHFGKQTQTFGPYPFQVDLNRRMHLAATWDGEKQQLFVDGRPVGNLYKNPGQTLLPQPADLYIGGRPPYPKGKEPNDWSFFPGAIHQVRISKGVLYPIQAFTPKNKLTTDQNTLALYHLDKGQGEVVKDASGNGHDGRIIGRKRGRLQSALPGTGKQNSSMKDQFPNNATTNYSLSLNGQTSYVHTPVRFLDASPFTLEAWVELHGNEDHSGTIIADNQGSGLGLGARPDYAKTQ